jgi:hypothetical protein
VGEYLEEYDINKYQNLHVDNIEKKGPYLGDDLEREQRKS